MSRLSLPAIVVCLCASSVFGDPLPIQPAAPSSEQALDEPEVPQRERALIDIFNDARRQLEVASSDDARSQARLEMQVHEAAFMKADATAREWVGTVHESGTTRDGFAWISIEIAPNIVVSTARSRSADLNALTLIPRGSAIYRVVDKLRTGARIAFNATFLGGRLGSDADMVLRPEVMAHFTSIRVMQ